MGSLRSLVSSVSTSRDVLPARGERPEGRGRCFGARYFPHRLRGACAFALGLACTGKPPIKLEPDLPEGGHTTQRLADDPRGPFLKSFSEEETLPENFRRLGQPCDPAQPDGQSIVPGSITCSHEGRVTGIYQPADFIPDPPATALILSEPKAVEFTNTAYVALVGETVWVRRVLCGGCRRVTGWSFIGSVPELSTAQLLALQSAIGLDASVPALKSVAEWKKQRMPSRSRERRPGEMRPSPRPPR